MLNWQKRANRPSIVITDQKMPVMTGIEAATKLRTTFTDSIKIVLLTGDDKVHMPDGVIDRILHKPVQGHVLRECIKDLM
jgi:CheY-like chemotaxis protein